MAKVKAPFKLKGSIGDLTFYENEYGPQVKTKSSPTKWHMKHHKGFANARRNAAEFKRAGKGALLLRQALGKPLLKGFTTMRLNGRMMRPFVKAVKADPIHEWGERNLVAGDLSGLTGFEFNHTLPLDDALPLNVENHYTIEDGHIRLQLPAVRIRKKDALPETATHYRLVCCLLTLDFATGRYHRELQTSDHLPMGRKAGAAFCAAHTIAADTPGCCWLLGVEFYKIEDGHPTLLKGGALRVMQWFGPKAPAVAVAEELASAASAVQQAVVVPANLVSPSPLVAVRAAAIDTGQTTPASSYQPWPWLWDGC
jgi:hypothetical protein